MSSHTSIRTFLLVAALTALTACSSTKVGSDPSAAPQVAQQPADDQQQVDEQQPADDQQQVDEQQPTDEQSSDAVDTGIAVNSPEPFAMLTSPFSVSGQALGSWFSNEGILYVSLFNPQGEEILRTVADADDNWRTEDFVPFSATLDFDQPDTKSGKIVFWKDNPTGEPQEDESYSFPVRFSEDQ